MSPSIGARPAQGPLVPLAYVRRLVIAPVALATAPDPPLPAAPPAAEKQRRASWETRQKAREELARLRSGILEPVQDALRTQLGRVAGITLAPLPEDASRLGVWADSRAAHPEVAGLPRAQGIRPSPQTAAALARQSGADAILALAVDRFVTHTGLEREIWARVVAYVIPAEEPTIRGPFYACGRARAGHRLFQKGFQKPDALLERDVATQVARRLSNLLETGEEIPLVRDCRIAVVPAVVPAYVDKRVESVSGTLQEKEALVTKQTTVRVAIPSLERQRDVLLQLDLCPAAEIVDTDDVEDALSALRLRPQDCWTEEGRPDTAALRRLADRLGADHLFLSRVLGIQLTEHPITVQDAGRPRDGVERLADVEVEAALYQRRDDRLLWSDRPKGGTIARTEYVRHKARARSDVQCVMDAARTAYAYLRFSFDEYERKFER